MTTVTFVGGSPSTAAGQTLAALLMMLGFLLLALTTAAVASSFVCEVRYVPVDARGSPSSRFPRSPRGLFAAANTDSH